MRDFVDEAATIYQHDNAREEALLDPIPAQIALEAATSGSVVGDGETHSRRLIPGHTFRLSDHPAHEANGDYVVASIEHEGAAMGVAEGPRYTASFNAVPASTTLRPARERRPQRQSIETATVTGPIGREIHTDDFGRVKVQFHWDLAGEFDDKSSTWLRVMQPWAGAGYGAQFLPRVGQEVLVGYLEGDPDRPVVLGCLHNGVNYLPYDFPHNPARSGIKTASSPGGGGGHELLFDDRAGDELVRLQSMRRLDLGASSHAGLTAGEDLVVQVGAELRHAVGGDASYKVTGAEISEIGRDRSVRVGGNEDIGVSGGRTIRVHGDESHHTDGVVRTLVGQARITVVGQNLDEPAHEQLAVTGQCDIASGRTMTLSSQQRIKLVCGESSITLLPDMILISGPQVQVQGTSNVTLAQGSPAEASLVLAGSATLAAGVVVCVGGGKPPDGPSRLVLDAEAWLGAPFVNLNCGKKAGGGAPVLGDEDEMGDVNFTVLPDELPPGTTSVTLVISTPDGTLVERECAAGGTVTMRGRVGTTFTVVDMKVGDVSIPVTKAGYDPGAPKP